MGERLKCYYTSVEFSGDPRYKANTWLGVSVQKSKDIFISFYQRFRTLFYFSRFSDIITFYSQSGCHTHCSVPTARSEFRQSLF